MTDSKFAIAWAKARKSGRAFYILKWSILIPLACFIGKMVGEYFSFKILFKPFRYTDWIAFFIILAISSLMGLYRWKHNEKKYNHLTKGTYGTRERL